MILGKVSEVLPLCHFRCEVGRIVSACPTFRDEHTIVLVDNGVVLLMIVLMIDIWETNITICTNMLLRQHNDSCNWNRLRRLFVTPEMSVEQDQSYISNSTPKLTIQNVY